MNKNGMKKIIILSALLFAAIILAVSKGVVEIPLRELFLEGNRSILYLRLLRVFLSILVGCGLSVSGVALQAMLRNPLAEPYLLGTSSGAGLGAVIGVILGVGGLYLPGAAFAGACASVLLVYAIARQGNKIPVQSLILAGVIVSIALSGITVFAVTMSADEAMHGLMWWLWGSLEVYDLRLLFTVSLLVISGVSVIYVFSQDLNAMSIGEEAAIHLGINTETVKRVLFFVISLITASLVCVSGTIGFVGLIIPHAMRFIAGPDHKVLIPVSCIGASIFMIVCDLVSRTAVPSVEIPIGVITAVIGAPLFIILLRTKQKVN